MLLDEPLAALDDSLRSKILPFLRRVREEFDIPMLLVSHDPIEIQALCDEVIVLQEGQVVARGEPHDVLLEPAVFPIANARGFENMLPCAVDKSDERSTRVRLGSPATDVCLDVIAPAQPRTSNCLVSIPARAVLIAVERPEGLSARNILPAVIEEIHSIGNIEVVRARLHPDLPTIAVEVGRAAIDQLGLAAGVRVFVIIKAMSCSLYPQPDSGREKSV
jgi:molybdate transport system ATP-binding protein